MGTKGKSPALANLLQAGNKVGASVQQIKTVVPSEPTVNTEPIVIDDEKEHLNDLVPMPQKKSKKNSKRGLELLLNKRGKQETETAKIPRAYHAELRALSGITGVGMVDMIGNVLESFFEENREAIDNLMEDYIKNKKMK